MAVTVSELDLLSQLLDSYLTLKLSTVCDVIVSALVAQVTRGGDALMIIPNFTVKDSADQTALALALWQKFHTIASQLIQGV